MRDREFVQHIQMRQYFETSWYDKALDKAEVLS